MVARVDENKIRNPNKPIVVANKFVKVDYILTKMNKFKYINGYGFST